MKLISAPSGQEQTSPATTAAHRNNKPKNIMNTFEIKGDFWDFTKSKLKQHWTMLTDDDLKYNDGKPASLFARIQKRTGERPQAVEKGVMEASTCG